MPAGRPKKSLEGPGRDERVDPGRLRQSRSPGRGPGQSRRDEPARLQPNRTDSQGGTGRMDQRGFSSSGVLSEDQSGSDRTASKGVACIKDDAGRARSLSDSGRARNLGCAGRARSFGGAGRARSLGGAGRSRNVGGSGTAFGPAVGSWTASGTCGMEEAFFLLPRFRKRGTTMLSAATSGAAATLDGGHAKNSTIPQTSVGPASSFSTS